MADSDSNQIIEEEDEDFQDAINEDSATGDLADKDEVSQTPILEKLIIS